MSGVPALCGMGMMTIPDRATGASVAMDSGTTNTYGTWVQITAGEQWDLFIHGIHLGPSTALGEDNSYFQLQLGIGPASSEIAISSFRLFSVDYDTGVSKTYQETFWLPYPLLVPERTRIAARSAQAISTNYTYLVSLNVSRAKDEWRAP